MSNNTAYLAQEIIPRLQLVQNSIAGMCVPGTGCDITVRVYDDNISVFITMTINDELVSIEDNELNYGHIFSSNSKRTIDVFLYKVEERYNEIVEQFNSNNK